MSQKILVLTSTVIIIPAASKCSQNFLNIGFAVFCCGIRNPFNQLPSSSFSEVFFDRIINKFTIKIV